jgi:SPOR domain
MYSRLFLFSTAVLISIGPAMAFADSDPYTLQVASFPSPELADKFVAKLVHAGEHPVCATVELPGRGYWTRVFVGLYSTSEAARRGGENLIARGIVNEFLVRRADLNQKVSLAKSAGNASVKAQPVVVMRESARPSLPAFRAAALQLAPCVETGLIPRPDAVGLALRLIVGEARSMPGASRDRGGLWVTGDTVEGLARLRWIVGEENAGLIRLDDDGRIQLDRRGLARAAGLGASRVEDPLKIVDYISSNEGLLLLVQLAEGRYRYRFHTGPQAPTRGKSVDIAGSINLDHNFDSRINPYRKGGKKLDVERPPEGFDSLVAINPAARWFNLTANYWVQSGEITLHELAEAYAKLESGLDYLAHGSQPGAHALALERERRLKSQRPGADIVLTAGSNRLLKTAEEIRLFYAEVAGGASQR